jgi:hypothetical protein
MNKLLKLNFEIKNAQSYAYQRLCQIYPFKLGLKGPISQQSHTPITYIDYVSYF